MKQTAKDKHTDARKTGGKGAARPQDKKTAAGKAKSSGRPRIGKRALLLIIAGALALSAVLILIILSSLGIIGPKSDKGAAQTAATSAPAQESSVPSEETSAPAADPATVPAEPADPSDPGPAVLTVGDSEIPESYFDYCYTSEWMYLANLAYESMLQYGTNAIGFDYTADPAKQTYTRENGETLTYDKYIEERAVAKLEYLTYYAAYARQNGLTLTEDRSDAIDEEVRTLGTQAQAYDLTTDQYIALLYGQYMNEARFRLYCEEQELADMGYTHAMEAAVQSPDVDALQQTPDPAYKVIDLRIMGLSTLLEDAAARCQDMLDRVTDEDSFIALAKEYCSDEQKASKEFEDPEATLFIGVARGVIQRLFGEEAAGQIFSETAAGQKYVLTDADGEWVYAIYTVRPAYFENDPPVTLRHIFVSNAILQNDEDAASAPLPADMEAETAIYDEDTVQKAYAYADEVYQKYLSGEKTEDAFAALADQYSHDTESVSGTGSSSGGLYANLTKGYRSNVWIHSAEMVRWAYDAARKPGDTELIQSPYGFHIVYFVERAPYPDWLQQMINDKTAKAQSDFAEAAEAAYAGTAKTDETTDAAALRALARIVSLYVEDGN